MSKNGKTLHAEIDDISDDLTEITANIASSESISDSEGEELINSYKGFQKNFAILGAVISGKCQNLRIGRKNVSTTKPVKPAGGNAKTDKIRRQHDNGFDLALLAAMSVARTDRPVSLKHLQKIAVAYDSNSNNESVTSKLHRWRIAEIAQWVSSNRRTLTEFGEKKMRELIYHVSDEDKARISEVIKSELDATPTF